jgi:hypothetical protein
MSILTTGLTVTDPADVAIPPRVGLADTVSQTLTLAWRATIRCGAAWR